MTVVSPQGLAQVRRYLLDSEGPVIVTRRHWIVVVEPVVSAAAGVALATWAADEVGDSLPLLVDVVLLAMMALVLRLVWKIIEYRREWFVVTDKRLLLTHGLLTRKVAIMPLRRVTDLSYNVSVPGRVLGYGEFVFESAGQDQALSTVDHLGRSQELFRVLSNELFGKPGPGPSGAGGGGGD
jgi:membrane protein YdbS with pleckstrin-like domain